MALPKSVLAKSLFPFSKSQKEEDKKLKGSEQGIKGTENDTMGILSTRFIQNNVSWSAKKHI